MLKNKVNSERFSILALGMFLYAAVQSPGYYWQQGVFGFVAMFVIFFVAGLLAVKYLITAN